MKRYTTRGKRILTVPPSRRNPVCVVHPVIRELWQIIDSREDITVKGTARQAGIDAASLRAWRRGSSAQIANVEAVLNAMGLKLVAVPLDSVLTVNMNAVS